MNVRRELPTLTVTRAVMHQVPENADGNQSRIIMSDTESPLTPDHITYFSEKLRASLANSAACDVEFIPDGDNPVRDGTTAILADPAGADFVAVSQACAQKLFSSQDKRSPTGLLSLFSCEVGGVSGVAIAKLEHDMGLRLVQMEVNGQRTFDLELIRELFMAKSAKVFKAGLFYPDNGGISGLICDNQRGYSVGSKVARFFLQDFLGAKLKIQPAVATEMFIETTEKFLSTSSQQGQACLDAYVHLAAELMRAKPTIMWEEFGENLPVRMRQPYANGMRAAGVPQHFEKDHEVAQRRLRQMHAEFENGARIIAPRDVFRDHVVFADVDNGRVEARIVDKLKRVGPKR